MAKHETVPRFIKAKPKPTHKVINVLAIMQKARNQQERDHLNNLCLSDDVKHYYLQGYCADEHERNPYQTTAMLAFHSWEAGHFDRYGR